MFVHFIFSICIIPECVPQITSLSFPIVGVGSGLWLLCFTVALVTWRWDQVPAEVTLLFLSSWYCCVDMFLQTYRAFCILCMLENCWPVLLFDCCFLRSYELSFRSHCFVLLHCTYYQYYSYLLFAISSQITEQVSSFNVINTNSSENTVCSIIQFLTCH